MKRNFAISLVIFIVMIVVTSLYGGADLLLNAEERSVLDTNPVEYIDRMTGLGSLLLQLGLLLIASLAYYLRGIDIEDAIEGVLKILGVNILGVILGAVLMYFSAPAGIYIHVGIMFLLFALGAIFGGIFSLVTASNLAIRRVKEIRADRRQDEIHQLKAEIKRLQRLDDGEPKRKNGNRTFLEIVDEPEDGQEAYRRLIQ